MCWRSNDTEETETGVVGSRHSPALDAGALSFRPGLASVVLGHPGCNLVPPWTSVSLCGLSTPGGLFWVNDIEIEVI